MTPPPIEDRDATPEQLHERCDEDYAAAQAAREQTNHRQ